uniref:SH3 domain-containing protein n=1 Tax=Caenorhabditis japonica TaxID=281687 RepID=A0A8R1DVR1_CAEJA
MTQVGETEVMGGNVRDIVNRLSRDMTNRNPFSIPPNQSHERRAPSAAAPPAQPPLFVVNYQYTATQLDELSLAVGDLVELINEVEDGWSKGRIKSTGAVGMFPTNFVSAKQVAVPATTTTTAPAPASTATITTSASTSSSTSSFRPKTSEVVMRNEPKAIERTPSTIINDLPTAKTEVKPIIVSVPSVSVDSSVAQEKTREMARVKYVYTPQHDDELALADLDVLINITNKNCGDAGWFEGELHGKKGLFPDNFVELVQVPAKTESGAKYATINTSRLLNFVPGQKPPPLNPPQPAVPPKPAKIATVDSPPLPATSSASSSAPAPSVMPIATTSSTSTPQKNNFAALREKMSTNLKVVAPEKVASVQLKPAEQRERAASTELGDPSAGDTNPTTDQVTELQHITKNRARPPKSRPMSMVMNRNRSSDESPSGRLSSPTSGASTNVMSASMFVPATTATVAAKEISIPSNSTPFKPTSTIAPPSSANKPALRPILSNSASEGAETAIRKLPSPESPRPPSDNHTPTSDFVSRAEYDALLDRFRALESRVLALEKNRF